MLAADVLDRARAALSQAHQAAADQVLKAPWPGIVSAVLVADGKYVSPRFCTPTPICAAYCLCMWRMASTSRRARP